MTRFMTNESIDVLTESGEFAGETKQKAAVHRDGDWHRCAHVWIVTGDGRVLLQRRSERKDNWPSRWDVSVAGHVSAGESAPAAAIREVREEIGLELTSEDLQHVATIREAHVLYDGAYRDNEIHEVFVVRREVDVSSLVLDPEEVAEVRLVPWAEVARLDPVPHPAEYEAVARFLQDDDRHSGRR